MAVASLVLGIISLIVGFIPFCGAIALIPAIIAAILGIVAIVKNKKKGEKIGMAVAGTIMSVIAIVVILFWYVLAGAWVSTVDVNQLNNILSDLENFSVNTSYYNF